MVNVVVIELNTDLSIRNGNQRPPRSLQMTQTEANESQLVLRQEILAGLQQEIALKSIHLLERAPPGLAHGITSI